MKIRIVHENGNVSYCIRNGLVFMNTLLTELNKITCPDDDVEFGVYLSTKDVGNCIKRACLEANKKDKEFDNIGIIQNKTEDNPDIEDVFKL